MTRCVRDLGLQRRGEAKDSMIQIAFPHKSWETGVQRPLDREEEWKRAQITEEVMNSEWQAESVCITDTGMPFLGRLFSIPSTPLRHKPLQITLRGRKLPATFSPFRAPSSDDTILLVSSKGRFWSEGK